MAFTPHQRSIMMETVTETYKWEMQRISYHRVPSPKGYIYKVIPTAEAHEISQKKELRDLRGRGPGCLLQISVF